MADRTEYYRAYYLAHQSRKREERRIRYWRNRNTLVAIGLKSLRGNVRDRVPFRPRKSQVWCGFSPEERKFAVKLRRYGGIKTLREARAIVRALRQQRPLDKADQYVR